MTQMVTPEEMAALLHGLRETEGGPGALFCDPPKEIMGKPQIFTERGGFTGIQNISNWLMALVDLQWPHL